MTLNKVAHSGFILISLVFIISTYQTKFPMTKTQRLINRIKEVENFENIAYLCEDFATFIDEVAEWGVDHIGGVDFDDPEVNRGMMNAFFASFGCTPSNPHPAGRYA